MLKVGSHRLYRCDRCQRLVSVCQSCDTVDSATVAATVPSRRGERPNERRIGGIRPPHKAAGVTLLWGLVAFSQIRLRRIDGYRDMQKLLDDEAREAA